MTNRQEAKTIETQLTQALQTRFGEDIAVPEDLDGLEILHSIAHHGTCREYSERPVAPELRRLIYSCALSAPAKSDLQQADIVEINDAGKREKIAGLIPKMPWVRAAPVFLIVCGNGRRLRQISELHDETFANDHLDAFFNATFDAGIVLSHLMIAAEAVGLVTCCISAVRNHAKTISDLLELPDHVFPTAGLCIGWPGKETRISARLPLSLTLQQDSYDDQHWAESITDYDHRRGRLENWDPADPKFRGWSQQKAKMYAEPQRTDFGAFVRAKGFCLD